MSFKLELGIATLVACAMMCCALAHPSRAARVAVPASSPRAELGSVPATDVAAISFLGRLRQAVLADAILQPAKMEQLLDLYIFEWRPRPQEESRRQAILRSRRGSFAGMYASATHQAGAQAGSVLFAPIEPAVATAPASPCINGPAIRRVFGEPRSAEVASPSPTASNHLTFVVSSEPLRLARFLFNDQGCVVRAVVEQRSEGIREAIK